MKELSFSVQKLDQDIQLLRADMGRMENRLEEKFDTKFDALYTLVDKYMNRTETWYLEHIVLRDGHNRLSTALTSKGIVTEQELH